MICKADGVCLNMIRKRVYGGSEVDMKNIVSLVAAYSRVLLKTYPFSTV